MNRKLIVCFCIIVTAFRAYIWWESREQHVNYLYLNSVNLNQHKIKTSLNTKKIAFFIGSSGVAGSNIPPASSLAENFSTKGQGWVGLNLAKLQAGIIESYIVLLEALKIKTPNVVFLGLSPSLFKPGLAESFSLSRLEEHKDKLIENDYKYFLKQKTLKFNFLKNLEGQKIEIPLPTNIQFKTLQYNLKESFLGPVYNRKFKPKSKDISYSYSESNTLFQYLQKIKKELDNSAIKLIVYFEPINESEIIFGKSEYSKFKNFLKLKLKQIGAKTIDYSSLFPSSPLFFDDYIHLTPKGNRILAEKLGEKL